MERAKSHAHCKTESNTPCILQQCELHLGEMTQPNSDPILDSINEGVFTVDPEWRITAFNRAAERITGVPKQDAVGRVCSDVFRASICEGACALRRTFSSGKPVVSATADIINASGKRIPIRISTALLRGQDGEVIGGVETFQDLSQVEQLRKELEARYTFEDIVGLKCSNCRLNCVRRPQRRLRQTELPASAWQNNT